MIDYNTAANETECPLVEPWSRTPCALYFRTVQQAWEWAETHGGVARGLVVRIDEGGERA